ncbi:MAG: hypothetical protein K0R03_614 [Moraxellaceae bacterium]|nr:hypothetical protein [Moraxellaceae bacterium]
MSKKRRPAPEQPVAPAAESIPALPAPLMVRLFALVYDGLLLVALWMITTALLVPLGTPDQAARNQEIAVVSPAFQQFILFPALVLVTWLFYGYFWTRAGQTLGMQTWRLQVLRSDGTLPHWRDAFARCAGACLFPVACGLITLLGWRSNAAFVISVMLGFLGNFLWAWWSPGALAWHDQVSGTRVWRLPPQPTKKRSFFGWFAEKNDQ